MLSLCIKDQGSRIGNNSFNLKVENAKNTNKSFVIDRFVSYLAVQYAIVSLSMVKTVAYIYSLLSFEITRRQNF